MKRKTARRQLKPSSDWAKALRDAGLRRTGPRIAVLEQLEAADAPMTHAALVEVVAHLGYDRATIYRNLMDLVGAGLVSRSDFGHLWRFELVRVGREHAAAHPHFLCHDCGQVSCLPGNVIRVVPGRGVPRAVARNRVEVQIKGRCDACSR